jgi:hypothetical protein
VINNGPEPHEFNILHLADGMTLVDVEKFLGMQEELAPIALVGGRTVWIWDLRVILSTNSG